VYKWLACVLLGAGAWIGVRVDRARSLRPVGGLDPDVARWRHVPLNSFLVRDRDAFVANEWGMYRASKRDLAWRHVEFPLVLPLNGQFADELPDAREVYYFVSWFHGTRDREPWRGIGLFVSRDDGRSWMRVSERDDIEQLVVTPDGSLYARCMDRHEPGVISYAGWLCRLLLSEDGGRRWREIMRSEDAVIEIERDAEHPNLVAAKWDFMGLDGPKPLYFVASDKDFRWHPSQEPHKSQVRGRHRAWDQPALPSWVMLSLVQQFDDGEGGVRWMMR
jgi:hypothetical protein